MLGINEYQERAHQTAKYPPCRVDSAQRNYFGYTYPVLGLAEEAGEVAGKFAKALRDDDGDISLEKRDEIVKELGDVCWFVAELATILGVTLEDVMQKNLDKLASRKERGVISGSGDNR